MSHGNDPIRGQDPILLIMVVAAWAIVVVLLAWAAVGAPR